MATETEARAREVLSYPSPNCDRETWAEKICPALKAGLGEAGAALWHEWSSRGDSYNFQEAEAVWRSWSEFGKITFATLVDLAKREGYDPRGKFVPPTAEQVAAREARHAEMQKVIDENKADPEGKTAVNTWRPIARWTARANIQPFLDHVRYLFGEEAEVFLDWAAHIEQRPGELPHYGWLHVARQHGCGRNWLASVFARVFRGYVAPNVDLGALLDSSFNGELGGRVLAVVDEVRAGGGEKAHAYENKLRSMVNPEYRLMNPKFGRQYKEHNACRWLVFSNHLNALPLNDEDRRWRAVVHKAPARAPRVYEELYGLLSDPEFINAVAVFLAGRDISNFKPGEKPPMTAAKQEVVASAKSMTQGRVDELRKHWPSALITHDDIAQYVTAGESTIFTPAMRHALEDVGAKQIDRQIKIDQRPQRVWALRDVDAWIELKGNDAIRREVEKVRRRGSLINAQAIMEEASNLEEATAL